MLSGSKGLDMRYGISDYANGRVPPISKERAEFVERVSQEAMKTFNRLDTSATCSNNEASTTRSMDMEKFVALGECIANQVCQSVAELPDRDSPPDWPQAMLVTSDELRNIVLNAINDAAPQAQPADALDVAFEAVRKRFCKLPRYSFLLDGKGNVRRVPSFTGNWVEFEAAHTLFDPQSVDAAMAAAQEGGAA